MHAWGTASSSNIEILQRFQSKILCIIANAPRFMKNVHFHRDLKMPLVNDEIKDHIQQIPRPYHQASKRYRLNAEVIIEILQTSKNGTSWSNFLKNVLNLNYFANFLIQLYNIDVCIAGCTPYKSLILFFILVI